MEPTQPTNTTITRASFVCAAELSQMFSPRLSTRTIHRLTQRRLIPFAKLGRRTMYSPEEVRAHILKHLTVRARGDAAQGKAA